MRWAWIFRCIQAILVAYNSTAYQIHEESLERKALPEILESKDGSWVLRHCELNIQIDEIDKIIEQQEPSAFVEMCRADIVFCEEHKQCLKTACLRFVVRHRICSLPREIALQNIQKTHHKSFVFSLHIKIYFINLLQHRVEGCKNLNAIDLQWLRKAP